MFQRVGTIRIFEDLSLRIAVSKFVYVGSRLDFFMSPKDLYERQPSVLELPLLFIFGNIIKKERQ